MIIPPVFSLRREVILYFYYRERIAECQVNPVENPAAGSKSPKDINDLPNINRKYVRFFTGNLLHFPFGFSIIEAVKNR